MRTTVTVIGGGYAGATVAKALDDVAVVTLIEPRDEFTHNVAALRALVDPAWAGRMFLPYDRLLRNGRIVRDSAVRVDSTSVTIGSGERITADFTVIATGSTYPFPAKFEATDRETVTARLDETRCALADAAGVLLLGAGPVGLELAGEITAVWPDKRVTVLDHHDDVLSGRLTPELRAEVRAQLDALGVELVLGSQLLEEPPSDPGETKSFTVSTATGVEVAADIWFRCYGATPVSDFLAGDLADARHPSGHLPVTPELRLPGHDRVFAIGDVTAVPEAKMAKAAGIHAEVVAANIATLSRGGDELRTYQPGPDAISLPLGPYGGASYAPDRGLLGAQETSLLKGQSLRLDRYRQLLGLD